MIVEELVDLALVIDKLVAAGVNMDQPGFVLSAPTDAEGDAEASAQEAKSELPLAGMTVVVTGAMTGPLSDLSRTEMTELIAKAGGRASSSVSARTHVVVAGEKAGCKLDKARTLGIETITPEELAQRLAPDMKRG
ncbi:BRCT domain-containing protein [Micromonospora tarensis]|uniref:BRCT domain-containing protein n=1 Tax=Micromonospora tarensis TaxID=2806100 RepID=A0ABS1YBS7_9ACTN|nr:BRCT domain-containing protein [Micromonospora tarensis]MBM0274812.1 hypothetical protein [Micromonospora tarensis]